MFPLNWFRDYGGLRDPKLIVPETEFYKKISSAQSDKPNSKPQCMSLSPGCRHGSFQPHGSLGNRTHDFLQGRLEGEQITFSVPSSSTIIAKGEITYWLCNHEDDLKGIAKDIRIFVWYFGSGYGSMIYNKYIA